MYTSSILSTSSSLATFRANRYSRKHPKKTFSTSWKTLRSVPALSQSSKRIRFSLMTPDKWLCIRQQDLISWQRSLTKMLAWVNNSYRQIKCTSMWAKVLHSSSFSIYLYSVLASDLLTQIIKASQISKCFLLKWHVCCSKEWNSLKALPRSSVECTVRTQVAKLYFHQDRLSTRSKKPNKCYSRNNST